MLDNETSLERPLYIHISEDGRTVLEKIFTELPITLGRSLRNDIALPQFNWISRRHAIIRREGTRICLVDLQSANGITLEGQSFEKIFIKDGLDIQIGSLRLRFGFQSGERRSLVQDLEETQVLERDTLSDNDSRQPYPQLPQIFTPDAEANVELPKIPTSDAAPPIAEKALSGGAERLSLRHPYPNITRFPRHQLVVEATVTWKGEVYDSRLFRRNERIIVGSGRQGLYVPTLTGDHQLGHFDGTFLHCYFPQNLGGAVFSQGEKRGTFNELKQSGQLRRQGNLIDLKVNLNETCALDLGFDVKLHLRYAPAPRQLTKKNLVQPDEVLKKSALSSGLFHALLLVLGFFLVPNEPAPVVKNVPERVAKLLVKKPEPKAEKKLRQKLEKRVAEKPTQKPLKKKLAVKKPLPPPRKVVVRPNPRMKKINKYPFKVTQPRSMVKTEPPVKSVKELGALAALGALGAGPKTPSEMPVAININPNAGGMKSPDFNTQGVIGALKAQGGRLPAAGMTGVKTQGKGYGTGSGYGVQGLQGRAGRRGVAGAVIGTPRLLQIDREEGLTQKQVMEVVKRYAGEIQQCYERALLSSPSIAGRAEYEWFIAASGRVQWAKVKKSDMAGADFLNECVTDVFRKMKFPVASNGESTQPTIGFPFGRL